MNACEESTDLLVDLSDTFMNNHCHNVQNHNDTELKGREDSKKRDTIDRSDISLSKLKLISGQKDDSELASLFKLVLPTVDLVKVSVAYHVRNGLLM